MRIGIRNHRVNSRFISNLLFHSNQRFSAYVLLSSLITRFSTLSSTDKDNRNQEIASGESKSSEPILALGRRQGLILSDDSTLNDADTNFEVLALQHKTNVRISLRQVYSEQDSNTTEKDRIKESNDVNNSNTKHKAPQHRRYLTYPNITMTGTPQQRHKTAMNVQLNRAAAVAHKYQLEQLGYVDDEVGESALTMHKGMNAIIEDKIQLSILRGDFDNLPNTGKPVETFQNPLIDRYLIHSVDSYKRMCRTTDLGYELLRKNGIKPEWIELQQKMTALKEDLRGQIKHSWASYCLSIQSNNTRKEKLQQTMISTPTDMTTIDMVSFVLPSVNQTNTFMSRIMNDLVEEERMCNDVIDAYNLQVPSHVLTRGRISLEYEVNRCIQEERIQSSSEAQRMIKECEDTFERHYYLKNIARLDVYGYKKSISSKYSSDNSFGPNHHLGTTVIGSNGHLGWKSHHRNTHFHTLSSRTDGNHGNTSPSSHGAEKVLDSIVDIMIGPADRLAQYLMKMIGN